MSDDEDDGIKDISIGAVCILVAIALFCWMLFIDHLVAQQNQVKLPMIAALIYKTLGKWGSLGVFGGFGVFMIACGVHTYKKKSRAAQNQCPKCGYDLSGNSSGACPECGKVL